MEKIISFLEYTINEKMRTLRKISRFAVALGGFLIFVGTIIITISTLIFFDVINGLNNPGQGKFFLWVLLLISLLTLTSGILLMYKRR